MLMQVGNEKICFEKPINTNLGGTPPHLGCNGPMDMSHLLGPVLGRTDLSRIFIFGPPDFFADFVAGFILLLFVGKKAPRKLLQENPGQNPPKFIQQKSPTHFSAEGPGQHLDILPICVDTTKSGQDVPDVTGALSGPGTILRDADHQIPLRVFVMFMVFFFQDAFHHDKRQKSAISGRRLHCMILSFL